MGISSPSSKTTKESLLSEREDRSTHAQSKARILSEQFMSVFTKDDPGASQVRLPGPDLPDISPLVITVQGVEKIIKDINPRKASGPDEIPTRVLHNLAVEVAPVLTEIYRQSIRTGDIPIQWKKAWITPVFKKGGRAEASNYRPVSLTSVACKLLEHIVCSHIRDHADNHGILGEENHGFRAKHSTETQLIMTTHDMLKQRDQGKQLDVIILDYSKAFDTVPHRRLLHKLEHYGIKGCLSKWIEAFLVGRTQSVVVDGARSNEEPVLSGVPQGTVLGPLMFLLYINDMPSQVHAGTRCRLFADDSLVYRVIDSIDDQVLLQEDLRNLEKWASDWGMVFNPSKCYMMAISKGHNLRPYIYELCGVVLKPVEQEKYLGVVINHSLSWSTHVSQITARANQKLGFIKRNLRGSPQELKRLAYIAIVRSSMEYACTVWDPLYTRDRDSLERIQRRAARWIANTRDRRISVTALLETLKLEPLEDRRRISRLTFMYKILNSHVAVPPDKVDLLLSNRPARGGTTTQKIVTLASKTEEFRQSFIPRTIVQWNSLPDTITSAGSVNSFRARLSAMP